MDLTSDYWCQGNLVFFTSIADQGPHIAGTFLPLSFLWHRVFRRESSGATATFRSSFNFWFSWKVLWLSLSCTWSCGSPIAKAGCEDGSLSILIELTASTIHLKWTSSSDLNSWRRMAGTTPNVEATATSPFCTQLSILPFLMSATWFVANSYGKSAINRLRETPQLRK